MDIYSPLFENRSVPTAAWLRVLESHYRGTRLEKARLKSYGRKVAKIVEDFPRSKFISEAGELPLACLMTWYMGVDCADPRGRDRETRRRIFTRYNEDLGVRLANLYVTDYLSMSRDSANKNLEARDALLFDSYSPMMFDEQRLERHAERLARGGIRLGARLDQGPQQLGLKGYLQRHLGHEYSLPENLSQDGAQARLADKNWWRRNLRKKHTRAYEKAALELNFVNRNSGPYITYENLRRRRQQKLLNEQMLGLMEAENEDGDVYSLLELSELSVSKASNRRAELMVRIRGFQEYAEENGHNATFVTLTCPGYMHSSLSRTGTKNPRYSGATPREAQKHLSTLWSRIRAHFQRHSVPIYGFRVAEPHHDGTPHWHLLVFHKPLHYRILKATFRKYALAEAPDERGAYKRRVNFKKIDPSLGSAAGYIAKYISKSIDGYGIGHDNIGTPADKASERIEAWASTWGIRQFQQFGGPPVSTWRELRRASLELCVPGGLLHKAAMAAQSNDWLGYMNAQGGALTSRAAMPIKTLWQWVERLGKYGEPIGKVIRGIETDGYQLITRIHTWEIRKSSIAISFRRDLIVGNEEVVNEVAGPGRSPDRPGVGRFDRLLRGPHVKLRPLEFYQ